MIFSDSLLVLTSLQNKKFDDPLIIKVSCKLENMSNDNEILLCWIRSHIGISRNDQVDKWPGLAQEKKIKILYTDLKMKIN